MIKNRPNGHATHFRLSPESWLLILEAYRDGATAKELAAKWKVAPGTIYRYVRERGFTKKHTSDAIARAHAQKVADEEAAELADQAAAPGPVPDSDPAALRKRALADMARAMTAGRTVEADRLGRLILTLDKLSGKRGGDDDFAESTDREPRVLSREAAKAHLREQLLEGEDFASRLMPHIETVARGMLGDESSGPAVYSRAVYRWRAKTFGPEVARSDFEQARGQHWAKGIFDEDGNILPGWDFLSSRYAPAP